MKRKRRWVCLGLIVFGTVGLLGMRNEDDLLVKAMEPRHLAPFFAVPLLVGLVGLVVSCFRCRGSPP